MTMLNFLFGVQRYRDQGLLLINCQTPSCTLISTGHLQQGENECTNMVQLNAFFIICELRKRKGARNLNKEETVFPAALFSRSVRARNLTGKIEDTGAGCRRSPRQSEPTTDSPTGTL